MEITQRELKVQEIAQAFQLFQQAPVAVCIVRGSNYVVELANEEMLEFLGRTPQIIGRPIIEALPEAETQGLIAILDNVRLSGKTYRIQSFPATLLINGIRENRYFNLIFQLFSQVESEKSTASIFCVAHNITDQVLALKKVEEVQEKLSFRNALFEALLEATSDGILIVDPDGKILLQNKKFEEIWNIPEEIISSRDDKAALEFAMTRLVDPDKFINRVTNVYKDHTKHSRDVILFKDGRVVERNGTPVIGEAGFYYGWAWYFRDVTDRIKQEQKFNNVVQQAASPILILKGEDMVLEVANRALFDLWKVDETALGRPFLEILPEMKDQGFLDLLQGVLRTGQPFFGTEVPVIFERTTGLRETIYFNFSYQPYREVDGTITGVLVLANDVTEQVSAKQKLIESERNLRNTILQAPVAMCLLKGPDYMVDIANERMIEFWGKTSEQVLNKPVLEGVSEARNQGLEDVLHRVYRMGEIVSGYGEPITLLRKGKPEVIYVSFVYQPFKEWNGTISGIMVVLTDVTEQVLARQQLEANELELQKRVDQRTTELDSINKELQRSNSNLEEFAYAASHDLKSPIRKISIFSQRLKDQLKEKLNENQIQVFKRIDNTTVRMINLIDDLLTFAHISKGTLELSEVDLNQNIQNVLDDLELEVTEKKALVKVGALPIVRGNKRQLQQLFQNLISNSLKYSRINTPPAININSKHVTGSEVAKYFQEVKTDKHYHLIEFEDNGIGFNEKDAEKIFRIFTRLHSDAEYSGSGIGLSIVKRVVESHQGHIWAEGIPGEGATFKILLPAE